MEKIVGPIGPILFLISIDLRTPYLSRPRNVWRQNRFPVCIKRESLFHQKFDS